MMMYCSCTGSGEMNGVNSRTGDEAVWRDAKTERTGREAGMEASGMEGGHCPLELVGR